LEKAKDCLGRDEYIVDFIDMSCQKKGREMMLKRKALTPVISR